MAFSQYVRLPDGWTPGGVASGVAVAAVALPLVLVGGSLLVHSARVLQQLWKYRHVPGPPPHLILGNLPTIIKMGGSQHAMSAWRKQYGPVFKVFFLSRCMVVVSDPDLVRQVMYKFTNHAPAFTPSLQLMRGARLMLDSKGLVFVRDGLWRTLRNAWQPAFAPGTLKRYEGLMDGCAMQLVSLLQGAVGDSDVGGKGAGDPGVGAGGPQGGYVDLHDLLNAMTLEVVGTCAYGVQFEALHPGGGTQGAALVAACKDFFKGASMASASKWALAVAVLPGMAPVVRIFAHLFPDPPLLSQIKARDSVLHTSQSLIEQWKAKHATTPAAPPGKEGEDADGGTHPTATPAPAKSAGRLAGIDAGSFLSLMLEARAKAGTSTDTSAVDESQVLDDLTVTAQANTFILAGTETTANTLSFAVYLLCQHPEAEQKLLQEIDAHPAGAPLTSQDKFPYADAVVAEALRLFPPAHSTTREVDKRGAAQVGQYLLPPGCNLLVHLYSLHHDAANWAQPEDFIPERHLQGSDLGPSNPNSFMPFGCGTRMCPGYKFAQQEARAALVRLYQHFTFELQPGQVPLATSTGITLSPKFGLHVRPVPRLQRS